MRADFAEPLAGSRCDALAQVASSEATLRRTVRRYSLCADDAEDAYQRAVEILLTKPLPGDLRRLAAWMQVVTRREALAVRRSRERLLGPRDAGGGDPRRPPRIRNREFATATCNGDDLQAGSGSGGHFQGR